MVLILEKAAGAARRAAATSAQATPMKAT